MDLTLIRVNTDKKLNTICVGKDHEFGIAASGGANSFVVLPRHLVSVGSQQEQIAQLIVVKLREPLFAAADNGLRQSLLALDHFMNAFF